MKARSRNSLDVDGILIVDKPKDWTSHDVCAFVRKRYRISKVGHAGTLDPMATGLLVLLLGKATKASIQLSACDKDYSGMMKLGVQTDSHDSTGKVIGEKPFNEVTLEQIIEAGKAFTGSILQTPPMVSALKHKGERLYKLARQGKTVPREGREVTVHSLRIEKFEPPYVHFFASVSKGTYVRTLVNDLGNVLGCFATLDQLQRVRSGEFDLNRSVTIETLRQMDSETLQKNITPLYSLFTYADFQKS